MAGQRALPNRRRGKRRRPVRQRRRVFQGLRKTAFARNSRRTRGHRKCPLPRAVTDDDLLQPLGIVGGRDQHLGAFAHAEAAAADIPRQALVDRPVGIAQPQPKAVHVANRLEAAFAKRRLVGTKELGQQQEEHFTGLAIRGQRQWRFVLDRGGGHRQRGCAQPKRNPFDRDILRLRPVGQPQPLEPAPAVGEGRRRQRDGLKARERRPGLPRARVGQRLGWHAVREPEVRDLQLRFFAGGLDLASQPRHLRQPRRHVAQAHPGRMPAAIGSQLGGRDDRLIVEAARPRLAQRAQGVVAMRRQLAAAIPHHGVAVDRRIDRSGQRPGPLHAAARCLDSKPCDAMLRRRSLGINSRRVGQPRGLRRPSGLRQRRDPIGRPGIRFAPSDDRGFRRRGVSEPDPVQPERGSRCGPGLDLNGELVHGLALGQGAHVHRGEVPRAVGDRVRKRQRRQLPAWITVPQIDEIVAVLPVQILRSIPEHQPGRLGERNPRQVPRPFHSLAGLIHVKTGHAVLTGQRRGARRVTKPARLTDPRREVSQVVIPDQGFGGNDRRIVGGRRRCPQQDTQPQGNAGRIQVHF